MIDDPRQHLCDEHSDNLAELALGILTGRERAATLAHVDACPRCAEELEQLSHLADAVVSIAPEAEPTVGFEVRLFNRMGLADSPPTSTAPSSRRSATAWRRAAATPRWALAAAAVVIALVLGLSLGWSNGPNHPGTAHEVATAALIENGRRVGRVSTYGGSNPWMIVTLAGSSTQGTVICEVVTANGVTHKVGSFSAKDGYGAWGAPLQVAPQDVRKAEVVTSNGAVIAAASLS
jgi:anti-sigma-K factor RskA